MKNAIQKLRDLRDNTPCDEESHKHCGCEKFDEIIDMLTKITKDNKEWGDCPHCGKCSMNYDDDGSYLNWECKTFP